MTRVFGWVFLVKLVENGNGVRIWFDEGKYGGRDVFGYFFLSLIWIERADEMFGANHDGAELDKVLVSNKGLYLVVEGLLVPMDGSLIVARVFVLVVNENVGIEKNRIRTHICCCGKGCF